MSRAPYQFVIRHCRRCHWPFHCPTGEQEDRVACRACESRARTLPIATLEHDR